MCNKLAVIGNGTRIYEIGDPQDAGLTGRDPTPLLRTASSAQMTRIYFRCSVSQKPASGKQDPLPPSRVWHHLMNFICRRIHTLCDMFLRSAHTRVIAVSTKQSVLLRASPGLADTSTVRWASASRVRSPELSPGSPNISPNSPDNVGTRTIR